MELHLKLKQLCVFHTQNYLLLPLKTSAIEYLRVHIFTFFAQKGNKCERIEKVRDFLSNQIQKYSRKAICTAWRDIDKV